MPPVWLDGPQLTLQDLSAADLATLGDEQILWVGADGVLKERGTGAVPGYISGLAGDPIPPDLDSIASYLTSATKYSNIPFGSGASWNDLTSGLAMSQRFDLYLPPNPPASYGRSEYGLIVYAHANGESKDTINSDAYLATYVRDAAAAAGYIVAAVEARHPVSNVDVYPVNPPHTDMGQFLQKLRSLDVALNFDDSFVTLVCRSRGTLCYWQSVQADMAVPSAGTYEGRKSSRVQAAWVYQGQIAYRTERAAQLFLVPEDVATMVAARGDNVAWQNAIDAVPTTDNLLPVVWQCKNPWHNVLVTYAEFEFINDTLHYPDAGRILRDAYIARNAADKIVVIDDQDGSTGSQRTEVWADFIPWMQALQAGYTCTEAWAIARATRRSANLYFLRSDLSGVFQLSNGTTAPDVGQPVGYVEPRAGSGNAIQATSANRPTLVQFANGRYGWQTVDGTDQLTASYANSGTFTCWSWMEALEANTSNAFDASTVTFGASNVGQKFAATYICNAGVTDNDLKGLRQLGMALTGSLVDPLMASAVYTAKVLGGSIYDFQRGSQIFQDVALTNPVTALGQSVFGAQDLASGFPATNGTAGQQPTLATINSSEGVSFSGDGLFTTRQITTTGYFAAAAVAGTTGSSRDLISTGSNNAATKGLSFRRASTGELRANWSNGTAIGGIVSTTVPAVGASFVGEISWSGANVGVYLNGVLEASTNAAPNFAASNNITIGATPALSAAWNGSAYAIVAVPAQTLNDASRLKITRWLAKRAGVLLLA